MFVRLPNGGRRWRFLSSIFEKFDPHFPSPDTCPPSVFAEGKPPCAVNRLAKKTTKSGDTVKKKKKLFARGRNKNQIYISFCSLDNVSSGWLGAVFDIIFIRTRLVFTRIEKSRYYPKVWIPFSFILFAELENKLQTIY